MPLSKTLRVNGERVSLAIDDPDMPLLYALRDNLGLHGPRFGCGLGQCVDWASYPILRFPEIPDLSYDLIDRPSEPPWGGGEPAAAVVPSAISNAVFDAAGVRLRSVPFTPDKVKAALGGAT
jgi:hypothetical protein